MSNTLKSLTPGEHSEVSTYLGFARDAAVIATYLAHAGEDTSFYHERVVTNLRHVASILGLELVERHPVKEAPHDQA